MRSNAEKAEYLLNTTMDTVEKFANRFEGLETKSEKIFLLKMLAGITLNALVHEIGLIQVVLFIPRAFLALRTKLVWDI